MKKVTVFVGSVCKRNTHRAAVQFLENLQAHCEVDTEIVALGDYKLGVCRGCRLCFEKGEAFCPLKDGRNALFEKITASDGIVLATPNYCWQVSGLMKNFIDRLGFVFHRPRYFGKAYTSIVSQAFGGGEEIVAYLDTVGRYLGFNTLKGVSLTGFDPKTEQQQRKIDRSLTELGRQFAALLAKPAYPTPSFVQLAWFRSSRTMIGQQADPNSLDYRYFAENGWLDSDYFYPARLGPLKKAASKLVEAAMPIVQKMMA
jgi:multimeric flavodoxin WrbA